MGISTEHECLGSCSGSLYGNLRRTHDSGSPTTSQLATIDDPDDDYHSDPHAKFFIFCDYTNTVLYYWVNYND